MQFNWVRLQFGHLIVSNEISFLLDLMNILLQFVLAKPSIAFNNNHSNQNARNKIHFVYVILCVDFAWWRNYKVSKLRRHNYLYAIYLYLPIQWMQTIANKQIYRPCENAHESCPDHITVIDFALYRVARRGDHIICPSTLTSVLLHHYTWTWLFSTFSDAWMSAAYSDLSDLSFDLIQFEFFFFCFFLHSVLVRRNGNDLMIFMRINAILKIKVFKSIFHFVWFVFSLFILFIALKLLQYGASYIDVMSPTSNLLTK